jgi:hypothetical protein
MNNKWNERLKPFFSFIDDLSSLNFNDYEVNGKYRIVHSAKRKKCLQWQRERAK